jgi:hypothetical protein
LRYGFYALGEFHWPCGITLTAVDAVVVGGGVVVVVVVVGCCNFGKVFSCIFVVVPRFLVDGF